MEIDEKLISTIREQLYSGVISDTLDELGNWNHALSPHVRPIDESLTMFGRARTGHYMAVFHVAPDTNVYEKEIALIDDLKAGDIAVLACPKGDRVAPWGELLSTAAKARGAVGCVTDGLVRDLRIIRQLRFPVFAGGIGPLDSKGRGMMMEIDTPVECGGVRICSGDWIFGDVDGVVVIPSAMTEEVIARSFKKVRTESDGSARTRARRSARRSLR